MKKKRIAIAALCFMMGFALLEQHQSESSGVYARTFALPIALE